MQNPITEAFDYNCTSYTQAEHLVFLIGQFWYTYFSNSQPTANDIDRIAGAYPSIQKWFAVLEFYGEKLIAETLKTENILEEWEKQHEHLRKHDA